MALDEVQGTSLIPEGTDARAGLKPSLSPGHSPFGFSFFSPPAERGSLGSFFLSFFGGFLFSTSSSSSSSSSSSAGSAQR